MGSWKLLDPALTNNSKPDDPSPLWSGPTPYVLTSALVVYQTCIIDHIPSSPSALFGVQLINSI